MSTLEIKQKLHNYLNVAPDNKLKALYIMMQADIEENLLKYTAAFKNELDERLLAIETGKDKLVSYKLVKSKLEKKIIEKYGSI
jgi:hypothetical protein